jgi:phosphatidylserine/phosphatidylglycerophosphate/cardiolipin synthase-like enzyme
VVFAIIVIVLSIAILILVTIVTALLITVCLIVPCKLRMESSTPPDGGWIVTLGGESTPALSKKNAMALLPDGQLACEPILTVVRNAKQQIHVLNLLFSAEDFDAEGAGVTHPPPSSILAQALLDANKRGVAVRLLMNQNWIAKGTDAPRKFFTSNQPNTVSIRGFHVSAVEMMHAKALIVDGLDAFVVGLPLDQGYWDTQQHLVTDKRRGKGAGGDVSGFGEVGNGVGNKPAHTVSISLNGPAAADVDATFINMWNSLSSTDTVPAPMPQPSNRESAPSSVQITRTAPRLPRVTGLKGGEIGTLEAYLRAISNAKSFIYLEAQYLTNPVIGDALKRALKANSSLQLIMVLNENPDLPTYKWWENTRVIELSTLAPNQVGAFTLWRTESKPDALNRIMQTYVESKVGIVDDVWVIVGSGNLDGASLGHIFELFPSPISCLAGRRRNVELNASLYDGIAGQPRTFEAAQFRKALWREHLGTSAALGEPPAGGWLSLWKQIATQNIASLNSVQTLANDSRILSYAQALFPPGQLKELGVDISKLDVAPAVPK